jgi:hypothetical protein
MTADHCLLVQAGCGSRSAFDAVRGYAALNNGEDQDLAKRLNDAKVTVCDP